jgi:hypothetical protein
VDFVNGGYCFCMRFVKKNHSLIFLSPSLEPTVAQKHVCVEMKCRALFTVLVVSEAAIKTQAAPRPSI